MRRYRAEMTDSGPFLTVLSLPVEIQGVERRSKRFFRGFRSYCTLQFGTACLASSDLKAARLQAHRPLRQPLRGASGLLRPRVDLNHPRRLPATLRHNLMRGRARRPYRPQGLSPLKALTIAPEFRIITISPSAHRDMKNL